MEVLQCTSRATTSYSVVALTGFNRPSFSRCAALQFMNTKTTKSLRGSLGLKMPQVVLCSSISSQECSSEFSPEPEALDREEGMPIPGTITFRRSATHTHYEYLTDLDSLGLQKLHSDMSLAAARSMGIRSAGKVESATCSTPVSVSIDVSKDGRDLKLDGIVRTAMACRCGRCGVPVAERVFANFSLLLTQQPVVEPTKPTLGVVLGDSGPRLPDEGDETDEVLDIDLDDKMHFPKDQKSIDISKYIRDTIHLEIPFICFCASTCKGICFGCGVNLNKNECKCKVDEKAKSKHGAWDSLEQLKHQLAEENGRSK